MDEVLVCGMIVQPGLKVYVRNALLREPFQPRLEQSASDSLAPAVALDKKVA